MTIMKVGACGQWQPSETISADYRAPDDGFKRRISRCPEVSVDYERRM
jgi:hypothetical protein